MPDWTKPMQQTFEYYTVDPGTWKNIKQLKTVKKSSISRDLEIETLGSATIDIDETLGECYVRIYLVTIQNGIEEKHPLGTFLVQTPSSSHDGKVRTVTMDAYTPLIELKEKLTPIGYALLSENEADMNIMASAYRLTRENARAPVTLAVCNDTLDNDFIAEADETWLSFLIALIAKAKYVYSLDEMGRILFSPKQDTASLQPVWTYDDGNSSILHPEISMDHDLYDIPNTVEVIYSDGRRYFRSYVVNDDPNSPTSTVNRGRIIPHRVTNPNFPGIPSQDAVDEYAKSLLKEMSTVEYKISYTHGYCPVRIGDCVRLDCPTAGLNDIKAKVISQNISCEPGVPVQEKAVFTAKLWG